jgi:hypothetical protein
MATIESFKPYHIGIKLKPLNFGQMKEDLKKILKTKGYDVIEEPSPIVPPIETLATKDETEIRFNNDAQALNTVGGDPEKVKEIFEDVHSIVLDKLGYEPDVSVLFYEIVATIIVKTDKKPVDVLTGTSNIDLTKIGRELDGSIQGIRISSKGAQPSDFKWFNLVIEPNPTSPSSRYIIRMVYRDPSVDELKSFHQVFEKRIMELIASIEGE